MVCALRPVSKPYTHDTHISLWTVPCTAQPSRPVTTTTYHFGLYLSPHDKAIQALHLHVFVVRAMRREAKPSAQDSHTSLWSVPIRRAAKDVSTGERDDDDDDYWMQLAGVKERA